MLETVFCCAGGIDVWLNLLLRVSVRCLSTNVECCSHCFLDNHCFVSVFVGLVDL